jgi:TRAP-type mannitol/chloroaromatic compound transport system permease small subunit
MNKLVKRGGWVAVVESVIDSVGRITLWLTLAMIALVAINVILRYSLSVGSVWAQEMEWHLLALLILLGLCYALQRGENVRVDVFYARFSPSRKRLVDSVSILLLLAVSLLFVRLSVPYVMQSYSINEVSSDPGGLPFRWLIKAAIPLGFVLVALQCCAALARLWMERRDV